jgi:hypothetical protein
MKTTPLLRAVVLGGGIGLLANPVWAGGGAHSYDKNQAGQQRMHDSGTQVSNLEKEKKKDIEQALQDKGQQLASHRHGGRANGKAAWRRDHAFIIRKALGPQRQPQRQHIVVWPSSMI